MMRSLAILPGAQEVKTSFTLNQKVSFEYGYYIFETREEPPQYKDVVFRLKRNFFPKWTRSIEPSALTSVTFYDEDKVLLTFDHDDELQGFWRKGTAIKTYRKPKRSKPRGIAVSLDSEGEKKWELQLRHLKGGDSFNGSKAFPDGSVGLTGVMSDEDIELYGFKSYKKQDKKDRVLLFFKVSNVGLLENEAMLVGENTMASLYPTNSASSIFFVSSGEKTSLHYNGFKDSDAEIKPSQSQYCPHLFIVSEDNKPTYELEKNNCKNTSGLKGADLRLASGFLEILRVQGQSLELLKVKYGQEKLDDETIPGLAYTPNFINEKTASSQSVEYTMSYAIPQKVIGVMVYFISDKRDHLDALRDPLFQASLNAAYFRNYVPITVWTSDKQIQASRVEGLFDKVLAKKILKSDWPWYMQAFGERAQQINSLYKDPNFKMAGKLDPKLLILWNFKDFPVSDNKKLRAEQVKQQVAR